MRRPSASHAASHSFQLSFPLSDLWTKCSPQVVGLGVGATVGPGEGIGVVGSELGCAVGVLEGCGVLGAGVGPGDGAGVTNVHGSEEAVHLSLPRTQG